MPSQYYLLRASRKHRSSNGAGPSAGFLFGLSRGFYIPPKESFHRSGNLNQLSKRSAPKEAPSEPAERPAGLGSALARLLGI